MVPYLMNNLVTIEIKDDKQRELFLNLIADMSSAMVQARKNPQNEKNIFKFDEGWRAADWDKMTQAILQEPHPETWNTVTK